MKNTFGTNLTVTLFGESHGKMIGAVVDGLAPGIAVDEQFIASQLAKRRPSSSIDTARREQDDFSIVSGVFNGKTTGTPLCIVIPNEDTKSKDYQKTYGLARPSHADYTAFCKYHGFEDYRGGGHFSGRITAPLVAVGAILIGALKNMGVTIGTHILQCAGVSDRGFDNVQNDVDALNNQAFPLLDLGLEESVIQKITDAKNNLDSVGGITQTAVCGLPAGVGEPWFDSVEGVLSHVLFSLGGVKGVEFGLGFGFADKRASECNDALKINDGKVTTSTNNNGGVNGGITNGMPIIFNCAVKPTPSISQKQQTINFVTGENAELEIHGRHDPAIIRRICPVINSVTAIVICDMLVTRFGTDVLTKGI